MSHQSLNLSPAKKIVNKQTMPPGASAELLLWTIVIEINSQNSEKVCESSWEIQFRWQPLLFLEYDISKQTLELLEID